eukprot:gnl/TRDRNA2_/TRDRNA2_130160_c0_seq1.p1 gnl/TRDRNA2_/TRDRNA2_130160_c0~~gnl/TRDRNA2_/TRDRNA2_130160_c0_seq1.p1  ORF type:complete len:439 (+),score=72.13 gnl/TRDRNA2_/TRDRNA2_130160_c0_seq1:317-1633(+)
MKNARALLDSLMGEQRNVDKKSARIKQEVTDWKDKTVCRPYLIGCCPFDQEVLGGRRSLETCTKVHSENLRKAFADSEDGKEDSDFRIRCEEILLRDIEFAIDKAESFAKTELQRVSKKERNRTLIHPEIIKKIAVVKSKGHALLKEAEEMDDCETKAKWQKKMEGEGLIAEAESMHKEEEKKAIDTKPVPETCAICGTGYAGDEEKKRHLRFQVHTGYKIIREKLTELKEKSEKRGDRPKKKESKSPSGGDRSGSRSVKKSRSPSKDRKKSRSRSKDGGRSRSGGRRDTKDPSRSRDGGDKGKDKSAKDDVGGRSGRGGRGGDRSRSDGRRSRSRSRGRRDTKDRSRSRGGRDRGGRDDDGGRSGRGGRGGDRSRSRGRRDATRSRSRGRGGGGRGGGGRDRGGRDGDDDRRGGRGGDRSRSRGRRDTRGRSGSRRR